MKKYFLLVDMKCNLYFWLPFPFKEKYIIWNYHAYCVYMCVCCPLHLEKID